LPTHLVDPATDRHHPVRDGLTIGRAAGCDIVVDDPMVSARHATLRRRDDGGWQVVDEGSRHGTYVGARRVTEAKLGHGDELLIGPLRLRFENRSVTAPPVSNGEVERLRAIVALTRAIGVEHSLERIAERILQTAFSLLCADRGTVIVHTPRSMGAGLTVARGRDGQPCEVGVSTNLISEVIQLGRGVITTAVDSDGRFARSQSLTAQGIRSVMVVPIVYQQEVLGLIHLDSLASASVFTQTDLEVFADVATQAGLAVKNAMLVEKVTAVEDEVAERLDRVLSDLPVGVLLLDAERRVVLSNPWFAKRAALLGDVRGGALVETLAGIDLEALAKGEGAEDVLVGTPRRVLSISAQATQYGAELVVVVRDVTQEREREARSAHKERLALIGQLAGGIAHDFNNLLVVILNCASFAESAITDDAVKEDLVQIRHAAQRAAELTRQLLIFSRREAVKPRVVEIPAIVAGMEKLLQRTLGEHIDLKTRVAAEVPRVLVDPAKVEQVVMNLVVNARDAMPTGGALQIDVESVALDGVTAKQEGLPPGRYALLRVTDNGVGMSAEVKARVFEPFFTTKEPGRGTGLGLATVYGVVHQAAGGISVRSQPGAGASFSVYFPETLAPLEAVGPLPGSGLGGNRGTILLAEDEDGVRRVSRRVLTRAGYRVLDASSGAEALSIARQHTGMIDLLLTDLVMPGMSGRELARRLKSERPGIRVLFMSGYDQGASAREATQPFLAKPFNHEELLAHVIDAVTAKAKGGEEN
jgi:signal transduction histidine kinase/ActR/RegA family two-component response regulator